MKTPRKLSALAVLGLSLCLGMADADAAVLRQSTAYGNWQVTEMQAGGAEMDLPYCAMSNYFSNDVLLVMSKNSDGTGSIAMDFNSNRLSLDKKYPVSINIDGRADFSFDAYPGNRQVLVIELNDADNMFLPMAKYPEVTFSLANTNMAFNLGPFVNGLNDMNGCLAALTGQKVAAVDLSGVHLGDRVVTAQATAPATTPMAGVAEAMWKTDAEQEPAMQQGELPSLQTIPSEPIKRPQIMSSNAAAQGVDLSKIYATDTAPSMAPAPAPEPAMQEPLMQEPGQMAANQMPEPMMAQSVMAEPAPQMTDSEMSPMPGEVNEKIVFSTNRQKEGLPPPVVITASQQQPMAPSMDGMATTQEGQIQSNYEAMRAEQIGQMAAAQQPAQQPVMQKTIAPPPGVAKLDVVKMDEGQDAAAPAACSKAHDLKCWWKGKGTAKTAAPAKTAVPVASAAPAAPVAAATAAATGGDGLAIDAPMDAKAYAEMRAKYSTPVYERRGVNVPLAQAIEQISPRGFTVRIKPGVNAQVPVSWNGGRPWRVLMDALLEPLGYSAIVTENEITLAAKKK